VTSKPKNKMGHARARIYFADQRSLLLSNATLTVQLMVEPTFPSLYKGGGGTAKVGG
jgi:hypothetical protein